MRKKVLVAVFVITLIFIVMFSIAYISNARWKVSPQIPWTNPEVRVCHAEGMPPAGSHCHWFWQTPHQHPV